MGERVKVSVEVPGMRLEFEGPPGLYEDLVKDLIRPVAEGRAATRGGTPPEGPAGPQGEPVDGAAAAEATSRPPIPLPAAPAPAATAEGSPRATRPSPPSRETPSEPSWNPDPLYARLAKEERRRAEKDAVLCALVSLAAEGRRDALPSEVLAHLATHGYPASKLKPKPILQKLAHRTGLVVPGIPPGSFRATPAGSAHIWKRARGG